MLAAIVMELRDLCVCVAAPVHLQREHPGRRLVHADPVEHSAHLLVGQHGRR